MTGAGFWIFLLIVVANLVITVIKKAAEKRAQSAGSAAEASAQADEPPGRRFSGEGDHEMILVRAGDQRLGVVEVLRKELRWDLPTAMTLAGTTPSVVATGLTRSEAGYLRNRFEAVGAGVSVRRTRSDSVSAARDLDMNAGLRATQEVGPVVQSPAVRSEPQNARAVRQQRAEALRQRRRVEPPAPRFEPAPTPARQGVRRSGPTTPPPAVAPALAPNPELPTGAAIPDLPALRAARAARGRGADDRSTSRVGVGDLGQRVRSMTRNRQSLREAFLLQELLRPPLSLRRSGAGGRDS